MNNRIAIGVLYWAIAVTATMAAILPVRDASAEQTGSFTGTWVASGKRQPFDFVEGRDVGTFNLAGNVSLKDEFGGIEDFWAECIGLSDSVAGSSVRCVWRSLKGDKGLQCPERSTAKRRCQGNRRIRRRHRRSERGFGHL